MIYTASLTIPASKALPKQTSSSSPNRITSKLTLDPKVTGMDVVLLGPADFAGRRGAKLIEAIQHAHKDICIIYLYMHTDQSVVYDPETDTPIDLPYSKQYKKGKEVQAIRDAVQEYVGQHKILTGGKEISSADFAIPDTDEIPDLSMQSSANEEYEENVQSSWELATQAFIKPEEPEKEAPNEEPEEPEEVTGEVAEEEPAELDLPELDTSVFTEPKEKPLATDTRPSTVESIKEEDVPEVIKNHESRSVEEMLEKISNYEDWSIFKENLSRDSIVKRLIEENSEYLGLVNMLDVLDKRIETVWRDTALSPEQKFDKIKDIGLERSVIKAAQNSINVEKVISIISTIVLSAKRTVDEKIASIDASVYKIATDKKAIMDTSYIDKAIQERTKVQLDLLCLSRDIVDLYKSIDNLITDEIADLDRKLPSSNAFINNMVKPIGTQIFTPTNTAALVDKLMRALQENRVVASQMEESVNALIETLFTLCEADEKIIHWQQNMINLLKANHVEDVIIVNSLLKNCVRAYIGADNTGRSATAIIHSGVLSRSHNTLLIDLTGRAKFREYGITPMTLDDFMTTRVEEHFLCVEAKEVPSPDEMQEIMNTIKSRLNYYQYVNLIVAPESVELLDQISADAKAVFYVTDCSTYSLKIMRELISRHKASNIAREVVMIDAPTSPLAIADNLGVDSTQTKLICLPNIPMIRSCSLKHDRPYEYNDVARLFEEAFR